MLALLSLTANLDRKEMLLTTLTVRNLEPAIKDKLRMVAAANGRSMEEEVRSILRNALTKSPAPKGLGGRIHARFRAFGGVELALPERSEPTRSPDFRASGAD
jgi:antitoxin FitA